MTGTGPRLGRCSGSFWHLRRGPTGFGPAEPSWSSVESPLGCHAATPMTPYSGSESLRRSPPGAAGTPSTMAYIPSPCAGPPTGPGFGHSASLSAKFIVRGRSNRLRSAPWRGRPRLRLGRTTFSWGAGCARAARAGEKAPVGHGFQTRVLPFQGTGAPPLPSLVLSLRRDPDKRACPWPFIPTGTTRKRYVVCARP